MTNQGLEIANYSPLVDRQIIYYGESQTFAVTAEPSGGNRLIYTWQVKVEPVKKFILGYNYPNSFNGMTNIPFELMQSVKVSQIIYDITGQMVKKVINKTLEFGKHKAVWDGRDEQGNNVSTGIYFYRLSARSADGGNLIQTNKLLCIK